MCMILLEWTAYFSQWSEAPWINQCMPLLHRCCGRTLDHPQSSFPPHFCLIIRLIIFCSSVHALLFHSFTGPCLFLCQIVIRSEVCIFSVFYEKCCQGLLSTADSWGFIKPISVLLVHSQQWILLIDKRTRTFPLCPRLLTVRSFKS